MRRQSGFTLIELLVVIAIIGILLGLLIPAVMAVREAARRTQCTNNLKQMQLAVMMYEDTYDSIPSTRISYPYWQDMGWMVTILPYIEQQQLYDQYHTDVRIFDQLNEDVLNATIPGFYCPSSDGPSQLTDVTDTVYFH